MFTLEQLKEIGEWCLYGLVEGEGLPFPRGYGLAYRRLYEHMPVRVMNGRWLCPGEPYYCCKTGEGDAMNGGKHRDGLGYAHHAHSYIVNPFHSGGLEFQPDILAEKKAAFPQYAAQFDALPTELEKYHLNRHGYIHSNPDMDWILKNGFSAREASIKEQIKKAKREGDEKGLHFLIALDDLAAGIDEYFMKVKNNLREAASLAQGVRRERLSQIADAFAGCFYTPAEHFPEGLLTVNFLWMLDGCDSAGRFDYALGALYEKDLASGALDEAFAMELVKEFLASFERMNAWNLQLGGRTPEGGSCYNMLTLDTLRADRELHVRRPNIALRITPDMPEEIWEAAFSGIASGTGKPALYNDDLYIKTLMETVPGLPYKDAAMMGFGGCTETMIAGMSCVDSLLGCVNLARILDRAVHKWLAECGTYDAFIDRLKEEIRVKTREQAERWIEEIRANAIDRDPKVMRSLFTRDCVQNRRSFEDGGACYNWSTVSYDGTTTLIDSLAAIKKRVYEDKSITARELLSALNDNFEGHERVRALLISAPKFGNDLDEADLSGSEMIRFAWEELFQYAIPRGKGGRLTPSVILFATYEEAGRDVGATPDGRLSGAPLNDSMGAIAGNAVKGPTALLNSVLKEPLALGIGTPVVNMRLSTHMITSAQTQRKVRSLVESFFARGGMQLQLSALSTEQMRAAQKDPESYRDLIVRIGGYSEYFVYLSHALQETVIARSQM